VHLPYCFVVSATYKSKVQLPWIVPEISAIFDGYQSDDWDYTRQKLIGMVFAQFFSFPPGRCDVRIAWGSALPLPTPGHCLETAL